MTKLADKKSAENSIFWKIISRNQWRNELPLVTESLMIIMGIFEPRDLKEKHIGEAHIFTRNKLVSFRGQMKGAPWKKGERVKYLCLTCNDRSPFAYHRRRNWLTGSTEAFIRPENQKNSRASTFKEKYF